MDPISDLTKQIRSSSRIMVRELGFMHSTLAATDYSPSAVHALLEIEQNPPITAAHLVEILGLKKSTVSRLIQKLIHNGEIEESANIADGRLKNLSLTAKGKSLVSDIHRFGQQQVTSALAQLVFKQQQIVAEGMTLYANALKQQRLGQTITSPQSIDIVEGYQSGLIGRMTQMHAEFYFKHANFGDFFERQIATGVSEFINRINEPCNQIWSAVHNNRIVGSIAIDGQDLANSHAHLRWFIIDQECRGMGAGKLLLDKALSFCHAQSFNAIELWTFKGLLAASKLYQQAGFQLVQEQEGTQWGTSVIEQHYIKKFIGCGCSAS